MTLLLVWFCMLDVSTTFIGFIHINIPLTLLKITAMLDITFDV